MEEDEDAEGEQIDSRIDKQESRISGINLDGSIEASAPSEVNTEFPGNPFNQNLKNIHNNDFSKLSESLESRKMEEMK